MSLDPLPAYHPLDTEPERCISCGRVIKPREEWCPVPCVTDLRDSNNRIRPQLYFRDELISPRKLKVFWPRGDEMNKDLIRVMNSILRYLFIHRSRIRRLEREMSALKAELLRQNPAFDFDTLWTDKGED